MMLAKFITTAVIAGAISIAAFAAYANTTSASDFVRKASIANAFEIESSRLALDKANSDRVKTFARQMIDDHGNTGSKLEVTLKSAAISLKPASGLDGKHQKLMDELASLSGESFDRRYIAIQTDAHKEAVSLFSGYAKEGDNAKLKDFAATTLPTLQGHLKHVQSINP